jgi:hypothetical protein
MYSLGVHTYVPKHAKLNSLLETVNVPSRVTELVLPELTF